jgi:arsenate reductase (thioredoxin)
LKSEKQTTIKPTSHSAVGRARRTRVLFVCVGNCCRSQMAEGFACKYGDDVMTAESAGLHPAGVVVPETVRAMAEKDIDITAQYSKPLPLNKLNNYDLIVNLSGFKLPDHIEVPILTWEVRDPIGQTHVVYCNVRNEIENLVMQLILKLRRGRARLRHQPA